MLMCSDVAAMAGDWLEMSVPLENNLVPEL